MRERTSPFSWKIRLFYLQSHIEEQLSSCLATWRTEPRAPPTKRLEVSQSFITLTSNLAAVARLSAFCLLYVSLSRGSSPTDRSQDSGAAYKDVRYTFEEWPEHKRSGPIAEMNPTGNIPIIEMPNGKILTQSYAIIRHWARQLTAYDGKTEEEKYWADAICDIVIDCRKLSSHGVLECWRKIREDALRKRILFWQSERGLC